MSVYSLQNNSLTIKVNSFGAELSSVVCASTSIEYIWQADKQVWPRHAPNLFPIVGKLQDGSYSYQNISYQLPQHGFARDNEFICIEQSDNYIVFEFTANEETLKVFPFHFSLQIKYTLVKNKVVVNYSVFNPGNYEMYFSIGAHPAFNCPLQKNESFNDYNLIFPNSNSITTNKLNDGLITKQTMSIELTDNKLKVSKELFANDALVLMNAQVDSVSMVSDKTKHGVTLSAINWPYFGIWNKKDTAQFICIEPWYGIADLDSSNTDLTEKEGIIKLSAEQYFKCSFEMHFF